MKYWDIFWHRVLKRPYGLPITDQGEGRPVVLLHGLASSRDIWSPLIQRLDLTKWRVIAVDLLGFGDAPAPAWNSYNVEEQARMVQATLKKCGLKEPATFVGHSMGCLIATHVAAHQPQLVKRLVLFEPPLFVDEPRYRSHARRRERYFAIFEYIATHPQLLFGDNGELRRVVARISGLRMRPETWIPFKRSLQNTVMQQTAYAELHDIKLPTDIIHGRLDVIVPRTDIKAMFKKNGYITWHAVNRTHGVSARAAIYLARLLNMVSGSRL